MKGPYTHVEVRVSPRSGRPGVMGRHGSAWRVRVSAPPERGRANEAVLELLAKTLDVPRRNLALVRGAARRDKVVSLEGLSPVEVDARLAAAVRETDLREART